MTDRTPALSSPAARPLRTLAALALAAALAACVTPQDASENAVPQVFVPAESVPVNWAEYRAAFHAANPDAERLSLLRRRNVGFRVYRDGRFEFPHYGIRHRTTSSTVSNVDGNRLCAARNGTWSGVCLDLYRMKDGRLFLKYEFGNGRGDSFVIMPSADTQR